MAIVISGNGIDMGGNPVSNASQIDGVVINENNESVATLTEANSYDIGVGQTWQYVTADRSLGVTYTNTTGKPIVVSVSGIGSAGGNFLRAGGSVTYAGFAGIQVSNQYVGINFIVPNNGTYSVVISAGTLSGMVWSELR